MSDDKYTDLSLLSSYVKDGGNMVVDLFPYESFKYNTVGAVKMLIEALKGDE